MKDCTFCRIVQREEWAAIVDENSDCIAFMDRYPVEVGHTLVAPKRHYENIFEMEATEVGSLYAFAARIARSIWDALRPDGLNVVQNNGAAAGQVVFHVHVHLVPRRWGSDHRTHHVFNVKRLKVEKEDLIQTAQRLTSALR
ncbi:MAG: HIT domain-containing protein [Aigarchaeota archaeon]|nr:HIT domain-containing protein [Aigarchaeota archaeon]MDW8092627.1 HIT domain-containing protein [Nitrososphaerota archaeon]